MPQPARSDLGVVAVTLAGFFLLYQAFSSALGVFIHLSFLFTDEERAERIWESFLYFGPIISLTAVGLYLVSGRYRVARGLFGEPASAEADVGTSSSLLLVAITAVGLLVLVMGLRSLAQVITQWIGDNLASEPLMPSAAASQHHWPYFVSASTEVFCGYLLAFRAPAIATYLRTHAH